MDNNQDLNSLGLENISLEGSSPAPMAEAEQPAAAEPALQSEEVTTPEAEPASTPTSQDDQQGTAEVTDEVLNDLSDEETIDLFIEGIMDEKGVSAPTDEIEADIKKDLKEQLLREIDRSLIAELPDDKLEELNRMVTANGQIDANVIAEMIKESNLDVTDIVGTTMARFREIYLEDKSGSENTEQQANKESEE